MVVQGKTCVEVEISQSEITGIVIRELYRLAGFCPGCYYHIQEDGLIKSDEISAGLHGCDNKTSCGKPTEIQQAVLTILKELY